jgi:hypothetical protein
MPKQTPRQIHKQYDVIGDAIKVNITQQYVRVSNQWKFSGYRCYACDKGFKFITSLLNHTNTCKVLNKLKGDKNANTENDDER